MWLYLPVPWVGLQFVSVVSPDDNHLFFGLLPVIVVDTIYRNISKVGVPYSLFYLRSQAC